MRTVRLGFEIGTGAAVDVPVRHMAVTGMTQEAGKTTALEALVQRSGLRAITFVTKRGERAFADGTRISPFFRERADWVFVSSLIDATLGEKNKLLRAWLMKVCRNTETLADVQRNVQAARASARGFSESIYTEIEGYLELVVPQLAQLPPITGVTIGPGLNVMDLSPYSSELQALVIRSVLEHVYEHENGVITVIPEAWEFLPEGRGSPVKRDAETLIRKGATLGNYLWLDSQDLGGVWKLAVRACPVVLIGVQREANEIKRTLANIPAGTAKPTAANIAHLDLGQFYACWGKHALKTYVQPAWMAEPEAVGIAMGVIDRVRWSAPPQSKPAAAPPRRSPPAPPLPPPVQKKETDEMTPAQEKKLDTLIDNVGTLAAAIKAQTASSTQPARGSETAAPVLPPQRSSVPLPDFGDAEALYQQFRARLLDELPNDPRVLALVTQRQELNVTVARKVITVDGEALSGRIARLIVDGWFDAAKGASATSAEMRKRGWNHDYRHVARACDTLTEQGFFRKETGDYQAVPGMKVNVVEA